MQFWDTIEYKNFSPRILTSLSVLGEYRKSVQVHMENTAKLGLFAVHNIVSEYTETIYACMEKTPRDTKLSFNNNMNLNFLRFFLSTLYGMD
jgi:hypothetical protein